MKDDPGIHSYPWYLDDWSKSETRLIYSLEERGLYRELLDACWDRGSLPNDPEMLEQIVAKRGPTHVPFTELLQKILKQFLLAQDGRWHHPKVDEKRQELFALKEMRREFGSRGGKAKVRNSQKKNGLDRSSKSYSKSSSKSSSKNVPRPYCTPPPTPPPPKSFLVSSTDKNPPLPPAPPFFRKNGGGAGMCGLKKTTETLRGFYPSSGDDFIEKLATLASESAAAIEEQKLMLTDELLADAIKQCREDTTNQRGAGLFLKTVPRLIATWVREGRTVAPARKLPVKLTRTEQMLQEVAANMKAKRLAKEAGK